LQKDGSVSGRPHFGHCYYLVEISWPKGVSEVVVVVVVEQFDVEIELSGDGSGR
jgi:hypothetical protein